MKSWMLVVIVVALHAAAISALLVLQGCATPDARKIERADVDILPELSPVDPQPMPPSAPRPMPPVSVPSGPDTKTYTVRSGDNVSLIAQRYNISESEIIALNKLNDPDKILVGQTLLMPGYVDLDKAVRAPAAVRRDVDVDNVYVVQPNDTISKIASRLNVSESALIKLNELRDPDRILVGQKLIIPDSSQPVSEDDDDDANVDSDSSVKYDPKAIDMDLKGDGALAERDSVSGVVHVVRAGDTLESIASLYAANVEKLVKANGLSADAKLKVGQRLVIPRS